MIVFCDFQSKTDKKEEKEETGQKKGKSNASLICIYLHISQDLRYNFKF